MINIEDFNLFIKNYSKKNDENNLIGELSEKSVHHIIKEYLSFVTKSESEVKISGFYADLCDGSMIYEIQTRNFEKLRSKLDVFLNDYRVTIVYPIIYKKTCYWIDKETSLVKQGNKRTSNSKYNKVFPELYKLKYLLKNEKLSIMLILFDVDEYRFLDGYGRTKKKKATKIDKIPNRIIDYKLINSSEDYKIFLENIHEDVFTTSDYKKINSTTSKEASLALNILNDIGVVEKCGTKGKYYLYKKG